MSDQIRATRPASADAIVAAFTDANIAALADKFIDSTVIADALDSTSKMAAARLMLAIAARFDTSIKTRDEHWVPVRTVTGHAVATANQEWTAMRSLIEKHGFTLDGLSFLLENKGTTPHAAYKSIQKSKKDGKGDEGPKVKVASVSTVLARVFDQLNRASDMIAEGAELSDTDRTMLANIAKLATFHAAEVDA